MRTILCRLLLAVSVGAFGADNHWNGSAGSWADGSKWSLSHAPGGNADYAVIAGGTAQITSSPAGAVARLMLGGASGADLEISTDAEFKDVYLANSGQSGTVSQTAGNVVFSGNTTTHLGRQGTGTYNLSGGTLTHNSTSGADTHTFIGVYGGAVGTINQTGGIFKKNGSVQQNMLVGYYSGSTGILDLSGGQFLVEVADKLTLGDQAGAKGYLSLSGTAQFQLGDGGTTASGEPPGGWASLNVGDEGYGEINQTGGSLDSEYIKIADSSTDGAGSYTISGGSLNVHRYLYLVNGKKAAMTVAGSGISHIKMDRFIALAGTTLNLQLDAGGITVMEVEGTASDPYHDAVLRGTVVVDTLPGFNAPAGTVFDLIWSANHIETTSMSFISHSDGVGFSWDVIDKNGGKMLQATVLPAPPECQLMFERL